MADEITAAELAALQAFKAEHGWRWKAELAEVYWYNARIWRDEATGSDAHGTALHGLRNRLGPEWLQRFRLPIS